MKPFIGIIGFANSGKSSIIASLTGNGNGSYVGKILNQKTKEYVFIYASSPQEIKKIGAVVYAEMKEHFQTLAADKKCRGVICAIQPTKSTKKPSMEKVFELAKINNFELFGYVIDPPYNEGGRRISCGEIKNRLQNFEVEPERIDGRKFGLENAQIIQKETKIILQQ